MGDINGKDSHEVATWWKDSKAHNSVTKAIGLFLLVEFAWIVKLTITSRFTLFDLPFQDKGHPHQLLSTDLPYPDGYLQIRQCLSCFKPTLLLLYLFVFQGYSIHHDQELFSFSTFQQVFHISCGSAFRVLPVVVNKQNNTVCHTINP